MSQLYYKRHDGEGFRYVQAWPPYRGDGELVQIPDDAIESALVGDPRRPRHHESPSIANGTIDKALIDSLYRLGNEYGPRGVATALREMYPGALPEVDEPEEPLTSDDRWAGERYERETWQLALDFVVEWANETAAAHINVALVNAARRLMMHVRDYGTLDIVDRGWEGGHAPTEDGLDR